MTRRPLESTERVRPLRILSETQIMEMVPLVLSLKNILVPIDFSTTSRKALRYAVPLAKQFGAKLTLLHVIDLPGYTGDPGYVGFDITETRQDLQRRLSDWATRMVPTGIEVETLVECGIGSDSITSVARNRAADLIVITTHGYTGLKHVLLGSTAERVVRHAKCPVLVVR